MSNTEAFFTMAAMWLMFALGAFSGGLSDWYSPDVHFLDKGLVAWTRVVKVP